MIDILMKITVICALLLASIYSVVGVIYYVIIPSYKDIKNDVFNLKKK